MGRPALHPTRHTRLSQVIHRRLIELEKSEAEVAEQFGWSKQSLNSWKRGIAPRKQNFASLAKFLNLKIEQIEEMVAEATQAVSDSQTGIPPLLGKGSRDHIVMTKAAMGYVAPYVEGCFVVAIDGRHHWVDPRRKPMPGNMVLIKRGDEAVVATWPVDGVRTAQVIVLAETV